MPRSPIDDLEIREVGETDAAELGDFFEALAADAETVRFFHPHPLTREFAAELCAGSGSRRDLYFLTRDRGGPVAYSMLRGWDEGFDVPSFGGCTHPARRRVGLGHIILEHAIRESRRRGATHLRLSVYKENSRAVRLYEKFGFDLRDKNEHEWVGLLDLRPSAAGR